MNYYIVKDRYDNLLKNIVVTKKSLSEIQEWLDTMYDKWDKETDVSFTEMLLDNLLEDTQIILNVKSVYF